MTSTKGSYTSSSAPSTSVPSSSCSLPSSSCSVSTSPSSSSSLALASSSSSSSLALAFSSSSSSSTSSSSSSTSSSSSSSSSSSASSSTLALTSSSSWIPLRSVVFIVASNSTASSSASTHADRGYLKSPWSRRKRKHPLSPQYWVNSFGPDGRLRDGGFKFLRKVRGGGIDASIRADVWPFLLGVYELNSSKEEREDVRAQNRREYEKLREQCCSIVGGKNGHKFSEIGEIGEIGEQQEKGFFMDPGPPIYDVLSDEESLSGGEMSPHAGHSDNMLHKLLVGHSSLKVNTVNAPELDRDSSDSESSEGPEVIHSSPPMDCKEENHHDGTANIASPSPTKEQLNNRVSEDFSTWRRIIRLDAIRANAEWATSPYQDEISDTEAYNLAEIVGLKDYHELEPSRIFHAARLVAILEAYALYDPEIGYCQGMSDLLSPIASVIAEDHEAFWCFVGFMKKARQNFRLDEVGIRRQLNIVSKIIKCTDSHLYRHLEKLQAEDCFFVYRMVVVLFRRELTFEQTMCLWEVMWADQVAIKVGIGKSAWSRIRQRAPPTEDLLLYAIAASVLQKRKLIIEKYSTMDEIVRECNSMSGQLDIWKLLDDAHDLVMNLHYKIESSIH